MQDDQQSTQMQDQKIFHSLGKENKSSITPKTLFIFVAVVIVGVIAGYLLSRHTNATSLSNSSSGTSSSSSSVIVKGGVYGSNDTTTFKDSATGVVQAGGIDGEGQYHLVRPGGDSQNVYMTSSLVDLSQFIGRKVTVNGQTQAAQHAGWLMDIGRVEVLN